MQNLYAGSYNMLMKVIKENLIKGKTHCVHSLKDTVHLRCQFSPKVTYKYNAILIKIPAGLFVDVDKPNLKCT